MNNRSKLVSEIAFRRGIDVVPSTIWRWRKRGWLPTPINIGRRNYYKQSDIDRFMKRAEVGEFAMLAAPPPRGFKAPA
jgi:predicted DNA-binding transcriptional regulator AlpA